MAWANIWILPFGFKYKSDISFSFFRSFFSFSDTHLFYLSSFFTITLVKQYNMQGSAAAAAVRAFNRVAVRTYTSQAPKATVISANNETLQYLDRLKDSEIEFQSKGEYVSNDFWKTEPGKYRQKSMDVSFLYIAFHREKTHKLMLHSPITRLATRVNEGERLRCFLLIMYLSPYSHIPSFFHLFPHFDHYPCNYVYFSSCFLPNTCLFLLHALLLHAIAPSDNQLMWKKRAGSTWVSSPNVRISQCAFRVLTPERAC